MLYGKKYFISELTPLLITADITFDII